MKSMLNKIISLLLVLSFMAYGGGMNCQTEVSDREMLEDHSCCDSKELKTQDFIENKNIIYDIMDVGFDSSLIPQMITKLKATKPAVMVAMTTPVAQFAKHNVKDIPLIFNVITDPVEVGLLVDPNKSQDNMTVTSDKQNIGLFLEFVKKLIPNATRIGVLYATSEANDAALVKMLGNAGAKEGIQVVAVPVDQPRDIPMRMQRFRDQVDFIYVGTSGPIQPSLPVIVAEADKMMIPVFNVSEEAVQNNQAVASFGVDYLQIGKNTGDMIAKLLNGGKILPPLYPEAIEHHGFISRKKAEYFGIKIPEDLNNVTILE